MTESKKRGRPEIENTLKPLSLRVETDVLIKLDSIVENERKKTKRKVDRSDIIREAILNYIDDYKD